jgi:RNA polymerase sigma factor (sigma-70 family)
MEQREYYLTVDGKEVHVTEEVYRTCIREEWREHRNNERRARCMIGDRRCNGNCAECPDVRHGTPLSLNRLMAEQGMDFPDRSNLVEDQVMLKTRNDAIYAAINALPDREKTAVLLFMYKASQAQIGKEIGMSQQGASKLLQRVFAKLAVELEEYRNS